MIEGFDEMLPGFNERDILEGMHADELTDHILELGEQATEIERKMNMASVVLEGAYGLTVEEVLKKREQNGAQE